MKILLLLLTINVRYADAMPGGDRTEHYAQVFGTDPNQEDSQNPSIQAIRSQLKIWADNRLEIDPPKLKDLQSIATANGDELVVKDDSASV